MKIQVLYFARVRELLGPGETVDAAHLLAGGAGAQPQDLAAADAPPTCRTVGELRQWLAGRSAAHAQALGPEQVLRAACNQQMCGPEQVLVDGAEVAFFPPVTGG